VNAVRTENKRAVSDVLEVLLFLDTFLRERSRSVSFIDRLLTGDPGLNDEKGRPIFANAFAYLSKQNLPADAHFEAIVRTLFNAETPGALHVDNLILRSLRVQMDGAPIEDISANGLGYNNLLYIATVLAHLQHIGDDETPLLLVEEPEAHLHPQLTILLAEYLIRITIDSRAPIALLD
jgi:hypothetical protein